jgi:preprotein translocase subunit YajC
MFPQPGWLFQNTEENTQTKTEQPPKAKGDPTSQFLYGLMLPVGLILIVIFLFWLPQRRQQRERDHILGGLQKDDKVLTHGGILGKIVSVAEKEDEVTVEIAPNVRIKLVKAGVIRNYGAEEREQQAAKTPASTENKKS